MAVCVQIYSVYAHVHPSIYISIYPSMDYLGIHPERPGLKTRTEQARQRPWLGRRALLPEPYLSRELGLFERVRAFDRRQALSHYDHTSTV